MTITTIMPVFNGSDYIKESLPPLLAMQRRGEVVEVIVVDDSSTDDSAALARKLHACVIPSGGRLGPGAARNLAAKRASGEILWFVDADVIAHDDAARQLLSGFKDPDVVAVFGSYDDAPRAPNFLSQYKNLVHHHYHHRGRRDASTFWAGCGAVRRDAFLAVDGFDAARYKRPSIEDIELGYRLRAAGGRILLMPELLGTHLKEWRFFNLIYTEIFRRAIPWSELIFAHTGLIDDLNVAHGERRRAVLAALFVLSIVIAAATAVSWWLPLILFGVMLMVNLELGKTFFRRRGGLFALGAILFHQLYYLYSSAAFVWCWLHRRIVR